MRTVLAAFSHPDDEVGCAGTLAAHAARGDRVVLLWLTRGEMTQAYGEVSVEEVAERRMAQGREAARILGAEARFLSMPDTRVEATWEAAREVARVMAEVAPSAVVTWGEAWTRGMRHPDHQATGKIVRDAVTLARLGRVVAPAQPHRDPMPVFTLRDEHSTLPELAIDVTPRLDILHALAAHYRGHVGWPPHDWLVERLRRRGERWGVEAAEGLDAWETEGGLRSTIF